MPLWNKKGKIERETAGHADFPMTVAQRDFRVNAVFIFVYLKAPFWWVG